MGAFAADLFTTEAEPVDGTLFSIALAILALGLGIVELIALPFGGIDVGQGLVLGVILAAAVLGILALFGRRRQKKVQSERAARAPG